MKYFLHDCNSFDDEKISELFMKFGYEGLGLFYTTLEKIGKQEKPVKTTVLKAQLKVGKRLEKCWQFMEEIGVINSLNGETFNENILNFSEKYTIKKEKTRKKVSEWREKQIVTKNVTSYKVECNPPKVKESKVKGIDIETINGIEEDVGQLFKIEECLKIALRDERWKDANETNETELKEFNKKLTKEGIYEKNPADYKAHFARWKPKNKTEPKVIDFQRSSAPLKTAADFLK